MDKLTINRLTYKEQLRRVKEDAYIFLYIENPTDELCLEAVRNNGCALAYIQNPTREMCLEAVKNSGSALQYVPSKFLKDDLKEIDYAHIFDNFS